MKEHISIPVRTIGPIRIIGDEVNMEVKVPLATFETPMWPSTNRGASVTRHTPGVRCTIIDERMTRSVLLEGKNAHHLKQVIDSLSNNTESLRAAVESSSQHLKLKDWNYQIVGNLLYLRLEATTGDASGHNMLTKAGDALIQWLLKTYPELKYVSISGNFCHNSIFCVFVSL